MKSRNCLFHLGISHEKCISDFCLIERLQPGNEVADFPRFERWTGDVFRTEKSDFEGLYLRATMYKLVFSTFCEPPREELQIDDDSLVWVIMRVEDQCFCCFCIRIFCILWDEL